MKVSRGQAFTLSLTSVFLAECTASRQNPGEEARKITVAAVQAKTVTIPQQFACQLRAERYVMVRAPEDGYFNGYSVREGQAVKKGDPLFKITPIVIQKKRDAELEEVRIAQQEVDFVSTLFEKKGLYENELKLRRAKLAKAQARAKLAEGELHSTNVVAPFDGIIDRMHQSFGSLVNEGQIFMVLADITVMQAYFNVSEANNLELMANQKQHEEDRIELTLEDGNKFPHVGKLSAIAAAFNNETGNIPFRADFSNPNRVLRHGQTGTLLINRILKDAVVIPRRATLEALNHRYVYLVDNAGIARRREIVVGNELDGQFVVKIGVRAGDKIVLDGVGLVHDGDKVE
jgi:membrane fusion protein (multidrug efflux system)